MKENVNPFSLKGKTALVTGATGYLGEAMAMSLARAGAHVLVNSRNISNANAVVKKIENLGLSGESAVFDVSNEIEIENYFKGYSKKLNILINNAYSGEGGTIQISSSIQYRKSFELSVVAAHNILKSGLTSLRMAVKSDGEASVINVASMYGMVSPELSIYESQEGTNPPFYGASKAALIQLSRYAAVEFGNEGIRVNSISPGPFPSLDVQKGNPIFVSKLSKKVPLGRIGLAKEITGPIIFLASSASSYVNGANLVVDGGWTAL